MYFGMCMCSVGIVRYILHKYINKYVNVRVRVSLNFNSHE